MRFLKCLVRTNLSDDTPAVILPRDVFNDVDDGQILVATKKKKFDYITLHIIKEKVSRIYEVFCEIKLDSTLLHFISSLKDITHSIDGVVLLNIIDGICKGRKDSPCTFDGFFGTTDDCDKECIEELRDKIQSIEIDGEKIIKSVTIEEVK